MGDPLPFLKDDARWKDGYLAGHSDGFGAGARAKLDEPTVIELSPAAVTTLAALLGQMAPMAAMLAPRLDLDAAGFTDAVAKFTRKAAIIEVSEAAADEAAAGPGGPLLDLLAESKAEALAAEVAR